MGRNFIETIMGAVVLLIAAGFLVTAYKGRSLNSIGDGVAVTAIFDDVSGIGIGSDVRMGGVKVGVVNDISLNPETYQAEMKMALSSDIPIPKDSSAAIIADGLLGSKFVSLEAGGEEAMMQDGDVIDYTQSSISLEQLIGKFIFNGVSDEGESDDTLGSGL